MDHLQLSVIIPAYNEDARLGPSLELLVAYLQSRPYASEIIVVDDGSTDKTVQVAHEKLQKIRHKIIENAANHGKGYVVRQGMLLGEGKYLLFSDADLSTPIEEVERFMRLMDEKDVDGVIGSRSLAASQVEIHQPKIRELMGKVFNWLARSLCFQGYHDSQCGFKCFRSAAAKSLFGAQKLHGFSFDVEILYLAQKQGLKILEEPVVWRNSFQSKVRWTDPLKMFGDLLKIRWLHRS